MPTAPPCAVFKGWESMPPTKPRSSAACASQAKSKSHLLGDRGNKYFLLGPAEKVGEIGKLPENFKTVHVLPADTMRGHLQCRAIVARLNCDLVHVPHLFWLPRGLPCRYAVTVHDLLEHMYR